MIYLRDKRFLTCPNTFGMLNKVVFSKNRWKKVFSSKFDILLRFSLCFSGKGILNSNFFHLPPTYMQHCCFLTFFGIHLWVTTCICFFHVTIGANRILHSDLNISIIFFSGRRNSSQHDIPNFSNISPKKYYTLGRIIFKIVTNSFELNSFLFAIKRAWTYQCFDLLP